MTRLVYDIYAPPGEDWLAVVNSDGYLVRVTDYGPRTGVKPRRVMGSGLLQVEKTQDFVNSTNLAYGNYVIVRDLDRSEDNDDNVIDGFFLEEGDFDLVTDDPHWFYWGGRSTIAVLDYAILPEEPLSPFQGPHDVRDGYWDWGNDVYGGVMKRAIVEANAPGREWLPMVAIRIVGGSIVGAGAQWDDSGDSNGDPWPSFDGRFRVQCGTSLLDLYGELYGYGVEVHVDPRTFVFYAYNAGGYGTDRTGAFGAGNVRFQTGVNITAKSGEVALKRQTHGTIRMTHILVRTADHPEGTIIVSDDYVAGDPIRVGVYESGTLTGDPTTSSVLESRAQRDMDLRTLGEDAARLLMAPPQVGESYDETAGIYAVGSNYAGNGPELVAGAHVWCGDLVTLDTGGETTDYNEAAKIVEGFDYELHDGNWVIYVVFGAQFLASGRLLSGAVAGAVPIALCTALDEATETVQRLYLSLDATTMTASPAVYGGWDIIDASTLRQLKATPDGSYTASSSESNSDNGNGADIMLWRGTFPLTADLAAAFAAGGATVRGQLQGNARHGLGISESSQKVISQEVLRVTTGDTTTYRGTLLDLHALASEAGSAIWPASATERNRKFPPAAAGDVLAAVSGSTVGDFLELELGIRNFTTVPTGATVHYNSDEAVDLPEDEAESGANFNSWWEFRFAGLPSGTGLNADLVGDDPNAARCDHKHHVISNRAPTTADNIDLGYPTTTLWTNTDTQTTYLLTDEDAGTWVTLAAPLAAHTHETPDILDLTLDSLQDVDTTGVADNDVLTYDSGTSSWGPAAGGSGSGAPTNADYLVGTANGSLSNEIVVGTSPGGELGGTWASPTVDGTHAGSAHADFIAKAFVAAKGDIIGASANDTPAITSVGTNGYHLIADSAQTAGLAWQAQYVSLNFIIDGAGATITTGIKGDVVIDFAATIVSATLLANQSGAIVVDIWKDSYANYPPVDGDSITSATPPTITASGTQSQDTTLSSWITTISAGDVLRFNVDSATSIQRVTVSLKLRRTV